MFSNFFDSGFKYFEWLVGIIVFCLVLEFIWLVLN